MVELRGRRALVTGGSRGIGLAVARLLVASGAGVLLVARGARPLAAAAQELGMPSHSCDVSDAVAVQQLADVCEAGAGWPDIVVHAAGSFELAPLTGTSVAAFDRALGVNLRAAFLLMRTFVPAMLEWGKGDFVSVGSLAGRRAYPHNGAYAASKYGLRGLHAVLDAELRGTGVRGTLVEPAATDTPLWDGIDMAAHPALPGRSAMLRPEAVAEAVLFALTRPREAAVHNIILDRN